MDDMIPRAAALDAISTDGGCGMCARRVLDIPAVDAVPVEWLEEHDGEDIRDSDGNIYGRRRITVLEALSVWRKEQEAR